MRLTASTADATGRAGRGQSSDRPRSGGVADRPVVEQRVQSWWCPSGMWRARSGLEVAQDRQYAAVLVLVGARPSLVKIDAMCFSAEPTEMYSSAAIAEFVLPCAMSATTSCSRGVSWSNVARRCDRTRICDTTSGSSAVPPLPTASTAARKAGTSATRSLSRYPNPRVSAAMRSDAYRSST